MAHRNGGLSVATFSPDNSGIIAVQSSTNEVAKLSNGRRPSVGVVTTGSAIMIDTDELFTKNTISEIKGVQLRLRADADAKQEELRLMVGERYRDLLQASSSIISMARSSQHVRDTFEEMKDAILSQSEPPVPKRASVKGVDDTQLHLFQLLSAHLKLLLDAPEILWRLIERKKYFPAAWLFLLSRVVHRALVQEDEQEEDSWRNRGIDVLDQFPLVQRQWEVVSQFRTQIIHKATLSLREYKTTAESVCATLLTLHILDSRPLTETLVALLEQRSKAMRLLLQWKPKKIAEGSSGRRLSGILQNNLRRGHVKQVKEAVHALVDALFNTLNTARRIFQVNGSNQSLAILVLEHIQSGSTAHVDQDNPSAELFFTSQSLLSSLPSSTQFLLLPPNIKLYKPFVDLDSPTSFVSQVTLSQKLEEWYTKSLAAIQTSVTEWLASLESVRELWHIRLAVGGWVKDSGLLAQEVNVLQDLFDDLHGKRATDIWVTRLRTTEGLFRDSLQSVLETLQKDEDASEIGPLTSLFSLPPLPEHIIHGSNDPAFNEYKNALLKQITGRSAPLDGVLRVLELCVESLQQDIQHILSTDPRNPRALIERLQSIYQVDAEALCQSVVRLLVEVVQETSPSLHVLIFVDQLTTELGASSQFITTIGCEPSVLQEIRQKLDELHHQILQQWQEQTLSRIFDFGTSGTIPQLMSLCHSLYELGLVQRPSMGQALVTSTFNLFVTRALDEAGTQERTLSTADLSALKWIADCHGEACQGAMRQIQERLQEMGVEDGKPDSEMPAILLRSQTLLSPLLPLPPLPSKGGVKTSTLLPHGVPAAEQHYQPPFEVAKSTTRFSLLLVGGTT
ncbi:hypothetical protein BDN72DRAFT_754821 [Pluteus cervinus]|uniref:Uncharacterized protein n=1 Tax=Pluteus cervinus TaxID=181527 RepID=A0ACD3BI44_9AGAR|nr:hypothetical protein BDN72DRAFT_754821 [Pluteus cervinus]